MTNVVFFFFSYSCIDLNDYSHVTLITVEKLNRFYVHNAKKNQYGEIFTKSFPRNYCTAFLKINKLFFLSSEKIIYSSYQGLSQTLQKAKTGRKERGGKYLENKSV